jgi:hypothetical protein
MKTIIGTLFLLLGILTAAPSWAQSHHKLNPNAIYQGYYAGAPVPDDVPTQTEMNAAQTTANAAIPQSAIGSTVAPLVGSVVPPANLPAATTSSPGAVQIGTGLGVSGGTASVQYGTTSTTAAAGNDSRITGALQTSAAGPLATQAGASPSAAIAAGIGAGAAGQVYAAPSGASGSPFLRALVGSDLPAATSGTQGAMSLATAGAQASVPTLISLGAACNATSQGTGTDDSSIINAAISSHTRFSIPAGKYCYAPSVAWTSLVGVNYGPGQIITSDGNNRAPVTSVLNAPITTFGNIGSPQQAFNGDLSHLGYADQHIVTGTATLGQPTTGYMQSAENDGAFHEFYNASGYNNDTGDNGGRTGVAYETIRIDQYGQGDMEGIFCSGIVSSTKTGSTNYLADPETSCLAGGLFAGANGAYLEDIGALNASDNGFDVAAVGTAIAFNRTNSTEALAETWNADNRLSIGSQPMDTLENATGPYIMGYDLSNVTFGEYRLAAYSISSGGTGYTQGETVLVSGGTFTSQATATATVTGGVLTSLTFTNTGIYSVPPTTTFGTVTITASSGSGAVVSAFFQNDNVMLLPPGGACIQPALSIGASPVNVLAGYYGQFCFSEGALTWGPNDVVPTAVNANDLVLSQGNTVQGTGNVVLGTGGVFDAGQINRDFYSSGPMAGTTVGSAQTSTGLLRISGTGTMRPTANQAAATTNNVYTAHTQSANLLSFTAVGIDESNFDTAGWRLRNGLMSRTAVGNNVTYVGDGYIAFTGSASSTTLTVTAVASGKLAIGSTIYVGGVYDGAYIVAFGTGSGGTGTYTLNTAETISAQAITAGIIADFGTGAGTGASMIVTPDTTTESPNISVSTPNGDTWHAMVKLIGDQVE